MSVVACKTCDFVRLSRSSRCSDLYNQSRDWPSKLETGEAGIETHLLFKLLTRRDSVEVCTILCTVDLFIADELLSRSIDENRSVILP
jgi:hypothetical protein